MINVLLLVAFGFLQMGQKPIHSLLVPGSYQMEKGLKRGYVYMFLEGALLSYYFYTKREMVETKASYIEYAREHASGTLVQSSDILSLFEKYRSFDDYYEMLYREARQIYPDDPQKQDEYVKKNLKTSIKWQWDTENAWYSFQDKRRSYRELADRGVVIMGFLLTNHLISLVDGIITDRVFKKRAQIRTSFLPKEASVALLFSLR